MLWVLPLDYRVVGDITSLFQKILLELVTKQKLCVPHLGLSTPILNRNYPFK